MNSYDLELCLVLMVTAMACSLLGVFLVLRRMTLLSDAIGHVLLLGIVLVFFVTRDLQSPWLKLGAALTGVLTVALVEWISRSRYVKEDAAIGLVFPALFALGILLASLYTRNIHLDTDSVLLGLPELAPQSRLETETFDFGPYSLIVMAVVGLINLLFVAICFKELKLSTFDALLASTLGFLPGLLHYALMGLVSLTAVAAFDAVGPVLLVAFFVVPAATAYLLTDRLSTMLILSQIIAAIGSVAGTLVALQVNTTISGTVATVFGGIFTVVLFLAPRHGVWTQYRQRIEQRQRVFDTMLLIHLLHHEGTAEQAEESHLDRLHLHLVWTQPKTMKIVQHSLERGWVELRGHHLFITPNGREMALNVLQSRH